LKYGHSTSIFNIYCHWVRGIRQTWVQKGCCSICFCEYFLDSEGVGVDMSGLQPWQRDSPSQASTDARYAKHTLAQSLDTTWNGHGMPWDVLAMAKHG